MFYKDNLFFISTPNQGFSPKKKLYARGQLANTADLGITQIWIEQVHLHMDFC